MRKTLAAGSLFALLVGCGNPEGGSNGSSADPAAPDAAETEATPSPSASWSCLALPAAEPGEFLELAGVDVREIVTRPDGSAVLAGAIQGEPAKAALLLLDATGAPDASGACGAGWQVLSAGSGFVTGVGAAVHADGSITLGAFGDLDGASDPAAGGSAPQDGASATVLGTVDANLQPQAVARYADRGEAIAAGPDGAIFLAGGETAPWIVKLSQSGTPDAAFGAADCADWGGCTSNEFVEKLTPIAGGVAVAFGSDAELRVRRIDANGAVTSTWRRTFDVAPESGAAYTVDALSADGGRVAVSGCLENDGARDCRAFSIDEEGEETTLGAGVDALAVAGGEVYGITARADGDGGVFLEHGDGGFVTAAEVDVGPELGVAAMALARTPAASLAILSGLEAQWGGDDWTYVHRNFLLIDR